MKKIFILFVLFSVFSLAFSQDSISENILDDFSVENTKIPEISNEEYAILYFKKINQTQTKLSYMNKKSSLAKIGTETINGDISGTLYYNVKVKGFGGVVTLQITVMKKAGFLTVKSSQNRIWLRTVRLKVLLLFLVITLVKLIMKMQF